MRRYVSTLQELGIPIEGERGVGGGYRMRPGFRLPPLMLDDDEAAAVAFGLVAAGRLGLATDGVDGALAKIHRVLPDAVRTRVEALESTLAFTSAPGEAPPVAGGAALLLAEAIRRRRRIETRYRTFEGDESRRELSPHGLVVHSGRWYLAAHDHGRDDLRTFRVDRMRGPELAAGPAVAPPDGFDAGRARQPLARPRARGHGRSRCCSTSRPSEAAARLPATLAELEPAGSGTLVRMRVSSLDWMARRARGPRLRLHDPAARASCARASRALASRLAQSASSD